MKRLGLMAGLLMCAGCFTAAPPDNLIPPPTAIRAARTYPPITPEQITETNGHEVARALEDEINREQQQNMLSR